MPVEIEGSFTFAVTRNHAIARFVTGSSGGHFDHPGIQANILEPLRNHAGASQVLFARRVLGWDRDQLTREIDHFGVRGIDSFEQGVIAHEEGSAASISFRGHRVPGARSAGVW